MTIHSPTDAISRVLNVMPQCWRDDYKLERATDAVRANRAMALDSASPGSSLDADIHQFLFPHGRDAMPMSTSPSAAMPRAMSPDNYTAATGGPQFAHRNHGSDQSNRVSIILRQIADLSDEEYAELAAALSDGGGPQPAEDQSSPMQFSNGSGTAPAELLAPGQGSSTGTFSESDPTGTGPRGTADSRPRSGRDRRRQAAEQRLAEDGIRRRYQNQQNFIARFPFLAVEVWR